MKSSKMATAIALFVLGTSGLTAQDTETRDLDNFDGISVSAGIEATLVQGNTNEIFISADGIDIEKVETEIRKDILKVGIDQNWWSNIGKRNRRKVKVTITYNNALNYISSSSGSSVEADHTIRANDLQVKTSSGADISLDIEANEVEIDVSSGSHMDLAGSAKNIDVDISSGASLDAYDLEGDNVKVDGSSGSTAKVHANDSINADVSSGASVKYKGNPSRKDVDKSSGGSVKKV